MAKRILQVNFKLNGPYADLLQANRQAVQQIARVPGLRWKIWLANDKEGEAGGLYLFDDEPSLQSYIDARTPQWQSNPAIGEMNLKQFEVVDELTEVTRGPVK